MPVHDWKRVYAGIFHAMHYRWIAAIGDVLNGGILPSDYYALPEQRSAGREPDLLTLKLSSDENEAGSADGSGTGTSVISPPKLTPTAETDMEAYRRKQNSITVRHVSDDRVVAVLEIVSPGNKSSSSAFKDFVEKAASLIANNIHFLFVDLLPRGKRDPSSLHGAIWDEIAGEDYAPPAEPPLTAASYEADTAVRAYVKHFKIGDRLPDMPLFLQPGGCVEVPLEATYQTAFQHVPLRWRRVLEGEKAS